MITALESIVCAVSSVVERAAGPSCHRPPHVCILRNMARPQPGNMNEIHFCVCVSSEHAEVQTAYWLFKASGRWSRVGGRCCSAAQVWLWMSAGGALILLPWGETSLSGPDPRVVPHSEILQLLAVYTPTVHPDSFADPETFQSGPTRWHRLGNSPLMGLTVVYMMSRTAQHNGTRWKHKL